MANECDEHLRGAGLRQRLAKVEALARAAGSDGERAAAMAAAYRLRDALESERCAGAPHCDIDMVFQLQHPWAGRLLTALCHRYAIEPVGLTGEGEMVVRAPRVFLETVLAPEFASVEAGLAGLMANLAARP